MIDPWSVMVGAMFGALGAFVIMAVWMAPKHWEQWHRLKELERENNILAWDVQHYKSLFAPREWGTPQEAVREREERVTLPPPWSQVEITAIQGAPIVRIDDIRDTEDWLEPRQAGEDAPKRDANQESKEGTP